MLTANEIGRLIRVPKIIVSKTPKNAYEELHGHKRCGLQLRPELHARDVDTFSVFVRQNTEFLENFSIGLRYHASDASLGTVTLV